MKDDPISISDELLRATLGELSEKELAEIREALSSEALNADHDSKVDQVLRAAALVGNEGEAPALPAAVRDRLEAARDSAISDSVGGETETGVYSVPKRYDADHGTGKNISRFHTTAVIAGGLAVAASVAVAFVTYVRPVTQQMAITFAEAANLLTPGEETAFLEPIFTWKADNGGVVEVEVFDGEGTRLARLDKAFSPLRWESLEVEQALEPGVEYELKLSTRDGVIVTRPFQTVPSASGAPTPGETLEGIIEQCESYIAANRPADAWMLWGELTASQKSDPRMQALKEQILAVIAG